MTYPNSASENYGGNSVRSIQATNPGRHLFAQDRYTYCLLVTQGPEEIRVTDLQSYTVFVLSMEPGASAKVSGSGQELHVGDAVQIESAPFCLEVDAPGVRLLIAGTREASARDMGVTVTPASSIYRVTKPWGHELWISGEHPNYAFKQIAIKPGTKTSLQYHRHKQETNVLFQGKTLLYYKKNEQVANDQVSQEHLGVAEISAISAIDISPPVIHRLEALTEVVLYEVSTPHLDDVIRIQDDSGRKDGRITAEHNK